MGVNKARVIFALGCPHTFSLTHTHTHFCSSVVLSVPNVKGSSLVPLPLSEQSANRQLLDLDTSKNHTYRHTNTNVHIRLFKQWNADHCSCTCIRMSNTLTLRRFWDLCCTVVANPPDKGVRVDGRRGSQSRWMKMYQKNTEQRQKISQRIEIVTLQQWGMHKQKKSSKKREVWIQRVRKHQCWIRR